MNDAVQSALPALPLGPLTASDAIERYIAAAKMLRNVQEQGGANRGQMVEIMQHAVSLTAGAPWCAAYVNYTGHQAFLNEVDPTKSAWPLPMTGGCAVIGEFADAHTLLHTVGQRGDLFLLYFPSLKRFAHVGIVLDALGNDVYRTLEGNTNDGDGSREGYKVSLRRRTLHAADRHRFVRWTDALVK